MKSQLNRLKETLLYSSAYLAFIAAAEVLLVMLLLSIPVNVAPLVVGLITFAVYVNDRIADADTDEAVAPRRTEFVRRHQQSLYVSGALAYGIAVAISVVSGPVAFALTLLPGVFWVLYALDWAPSIGGHIQRLKQVLIVNSAVVALAWSVTIVGLPHAFTGTALTPAAWIVFVYLFLATFINTEIPNVRDIESDEAAGVATLPVVFGIRRTRQSLYGVALLTVGVLALSVSLGYLSLLPGIALSIGSVCLLGVIGLVGRLDDERLLAISAEFTRLPVLVVLVISTISL